MLLNKIVVLNILCSILHFMGTLRWETVSYVMSDLTLTQLFFNAKFDFSSKYPMFFP